MKDIAIVICNYNKKEYLKECLHSIQQADFKNYSKDIIVVDNASSDGSEAMIKEDFPNVVLIQTGANLGGAGGFAAGMQYALDNQYRYVSVLDNDTKVAPDSFLKLLSHLKEDSSLGVAGATILQMDDPRKIQEMGANIDFENYMLSLNHVNTDIDDTTLPEVLECDYVPACCFMTRLEVLQDIGVFDKDYFIYFDDVDWNTRAKRAGYKIKAFKDVHIWHKGGAKLLNNTFTQYYSYRNMIRYFLKYINHEKFEHFSTSFCDRIQKVVFFSNLKNEFNSTKSILLAVDDAYAGNMGARFEAVFPKENQPNQFYELCTQKHNILLIDHAAPKALETIVHNIKSVTDAKVTVVEQVQTDSISAYDLVCHAIDHILDYTGYKESEKIFIDAYGNYILDTADKEKLGHYDQYTTFFNQVLQPVLKYKFFNIFSNISYQKAY